MPLCKACCHIGEGEDWDFRFLKDINYREDPHCLWQVLTAAAHAMQPQTIHTSTRSAGVALAHPATFYYDVMLCVCGGPLNVLRDDVLAYKTTNSCCTGRALEFQYSNKAKEEAVDVTGTQSYRIDPGTKRQCVSLHAHCSWAQSVAPYHAHAPIYTQMHASDARLGP